MAMDFSIAIYLLFLFVKLILSNNERFNRPFYFFIIYNSTMLWFNTHIILRFSHIE